MSGSSDLTLRLGETLGPAPRGRLAAPVPLRWPNKNPNDVLVYTLDCTEVIAEGDSISLAVCAIVPAHPGGLVAGAPVVNGDVISVKLSAGVAGEDYALTMTVILKSGQVLQPTCGLYVPAPMYPAPAS
jgi:hypothetical protein